MPATGNSWTSEAVAAHRRAFHAALRPASASFTAHAAIDAVRRALPRDGLLSFDVGAHTHQIASQWTAHAPKTFHITNGWSSMGFGLPGAIAAKLVRPEPEFRARRRKPLAQRWQVRVVRCDHRREDRHQDQQEDDRKTHDAQRIAHEAPHEDAELGDARRPHGAARVLDRVGDDTHVAASRERGSSVR